MIMMHGHRDTITGTLLRKTIEQIAIESGNPFEYDPSTYTTNNTWIQNTISSCNKYQINIVPRFQGLPMWTTRDEYIMEKAVTTLQGKELATFNKVRMYLQVTTVSDLSTADGSCIDSNLMIGNRGTSPSPSRWAYSWPTVPGPTHSEKKAWTASLGRLMGVTTANPSLDTNNYRWYHPECIDISCWNLNLQTVEILQKRKHGWNIWEPDVIDVRVTRGRTLYKLTEKTTQIISHKNQCRPITIQHQEENKIALTSRGRYHYQQEESIQKQPWYLPPSADTISEESKNTFLTAVSKGIGSIVADGSYKSGRSSAAVIFQHQKKMGSTTKRTHVRLQFQGTGMNKVLIAESSAVSSLGLR